ncbi:MAG: glycerophosphodiester phosphodiesterase, partial [Actinobacteria bacterium]|nr:glycerophosphodiester phosphodiesterase [Actinomycetota bacterium]
VLYTTTYMNIIGHRGVAGLELENTYSSFMRALNIGLQAVELDVRKTKDDQLVVCHDADLQRVAHRSEKIRDLNLSELRKIVLIDGSYIITLREALQILERLHVYIEVKDEGCGRVLMSVLNNFQRQSVTIVSFKLRELAIYRDLDSRYDLYGAERTRPFDIIHLAKILRLDGIALNFWLLNPLTYYLCKRANLKLYVYTVNSTFIARLLAALYPDVGICTDFPDKLLKRKKAS